MGKCAASSWIVVVIGFISIIWENFNSTKNEKTTKKMGISGLLSYSFSINSPN